MPFGESMISTLKSNTSIMLNQSKWFRKTIGGNNKQRQSTGNLPNAIPQQLKEIRERIKREISDTIRAHPMSNLSMECKNLSLREFLASHQAKGIHWTSHITSAKLQY